MTHPPAHRLDALAAGDADPTAQEHVASCEPCAAYVSAGRAGAEAFRAKGEADAFVAGVKTRAAARHHRVTHLVWLTAPALAAAAALALWIRSPAPGPASAPASASAPALTHFKGEHVVFAILDRGGTQRRVAGSIEVEPGDRLRVEVSVDHDEPLTAGLLSSDGSWAPLLAPTSLAAGTHLSELAARFDDSPTDALLLVGSPDDVARARTTRQLGGLVAWPVRSAPRE